MKTLSQAALSFAVLALLLAGGCGDSYNDIPPGSPDAGAGGGQSEASTGGAAGVAGSAGKADAGKGDAGSAGSDGGDCVHAADCDKDPSNGCETPIDTVEHCGACDIACDPRDHAISECHDTQCSLDCVAGFGDCDSDLANGCEAEFNTDSANCGGCGKPCDAPAHTIAKCETGTCGWQCEGGWGDCNQTAADGCEVELPGTDVANCGACGNACSSVHGTPSCVAGVCTIACSTGYGDCDALVSNGCEQELLTDAHHCGACGHDCAAGTCSAGYCTAWVLATETIMPKRIAAYGGYVYWTLMTSIRRVPAAGGSVSSVQATVSDATDLAVDASGVYWLEYANPGKVRWSDVSGGTIKDLATGQIFPEMIDIDATNVYWTTSSQVLKVTKAGLGLTSLVNSLSNAKGLHASGDRVYFSILQTNGAIRSVLKAGSGLADIVVTQSDIRDFAVDGAGYVYFAPATGLLNRAVLGNPAPVQLASGLSTPVTAFAIDDKSIYVIESQPWSIRQYPIAGGPGITRFQGVAPADLTSDATTLYFTDVSTKQVYAMVK